MKRAFVLRVSVLQGRDPSFRIPWNYGFAWFDPSKAFSICLPIPLNYIAGAARELWHALRVGFPERKRCLVCRVEQLQELLDDYKANAKLVQVRILKESPEPPPNKHKANFLFGHDDDSPEAIAYELVNGTTEEYLKECWDALVAKLTTLENVRWKLFVDLAKSFRDASDVEARMALDDRLSMNIRDEHGLRSKFLGVVAEEFLQRSETEKDGVSISFDRGAMKPTAWPGGEIYPGELRDWEEDKYRG